MWVIVSSEGGEKKPPLLLGERAGVRGRSAIGETSAYYILA
jgi:hypothetical protein